MWLWTESSCGSPLPLALTQSHAVNFLLDTLLLTGRRGEAPRQGGAPWRWAAAPPAFCPAHFTREFGGQPGLMNQCGSKTWLAVYLLVGLLFLVFEIKEWELFADLGRVCQGQWGVITGEKVLAAWEEFHILRVTGPLRREGCLRYSEHKWLQRQ